MVEVGEQTDLHTAADANVCKMTETGAAPVLAPRPDEGWLEAALVDVWND